MINYRNIFNPANTYIGIMIIILLALSIVIIQKDYIASIKQISRTFFISGIIILIINLLFNFVIEFLIISNYKIFIEIITKKIIDSLYLYSISIIIISSIINFLIKISYSLKKQI